MAFVYSTSLTVINGFFEFCAHAGGVMNTCMCIWLLIQHKSMIQKLDNYFRQELF